MRRKRLRQDEIGCSLNREMRRGERSQNLPRRAEKRWAETKEERRRTCLSFIWLKTGVFGGEVVHGNKAFEYWKKSANNFSPHLCVGFLFELAFPPASRRHLSHMHLTRTHDIHLLTHTCAQHPQLVHTLFTHLLKLIFPNYDVECTGAKDNHLQTEKKRFQWRRELSSWCTKSGAYYLKHSSKAQIRTRLK